MGSSLVYQFCKLSCKHDDTFQKKNAEQFLAKTSTLQKKNTVNFIVMSPNLL